MEITKSLEFLLAYGEENGLIVGLDVIVARNSLLEMFNLIEPFNGELTRVEREFELNLILDDILNYGFEIGLIPQNTTTYRDILESKIMAIFTPRQRELERDFADIAQNQSVQAATNHFYKLSKDTNYIKVKRVAKNLYWRTDTKYGELEITINLSKPEKDPKEIALAKTLAETNYPKCLLCLENIGFGGNANHPSRHNHRVLPLKLNGEDWYFQYSPYLYYNEHCIIFCRDHVPMELGRETFVRLFEFVAQFPHYFLGSNADLPIVGGSILTHNHFQGGNHDFPMALAPVEKHFSSAKFENVSIGIVKWPMSCLRLSSDNAQNLVELSDQIFEQWKKYSDPDVNILSHSQEIPHNTVTPIARKNANGQFEIDLVLRNNRTTDEFPDGIFHPHKELHHIKKENIGLIEVMGLAVLPGRLKEEIASGKLEEQYVGQQFEKVLEHAGVFKHDEKGQAAFEKFVQKFL